MEYSKAIVRPPGASFAGGLTTATGDPPDALKALTQHMAYCGALEACGLEVTVMEREEDHHDATFVEDTFVIAGDMAIATRPGAKSRQGEVAAVASAVRRFFS